MTWILMIAFPGIALQNTVAGTTMAIILLFSLFITFYGYRVLRISMIFQSIMLGGVIGWIISKIIENSMSNLDTMKILSLHIGFATLFAFICFLLSIRLPTCALFGIGFGVGIQISSIIYALCLKQSFQHSAEGISIIMISGLIFALCTVFCFCIKIWHVALTAWIGAFWTINALSYFINGFHEEFSPFPDVNHNYSNQYFAFAIGTFCLAILSLLIQLLHTSVGIYHPTISTTKNNKLDEISDEETVTGHYTRVYDSDEETMKKKKKTPRSHVQKEQSPDVPSPKKMHYFSSLFHSSPKSHAQITSP